MKHLSATQIVMFLRCPMQWYYRYVLGLKIPPNGVLIRGGAVHKAQEVNYSQKIESETDLPLSDVQDAARDAFEEKAKEAVFGKDEKRGELKDSTVVLAGLYHRKVAPSIQPAAVEEEVLLSLPGVSLPVLGYIDVRDQVDNVRDTKTAGKSPAKTVAAKSIPLTIYAGARLAADPLNPKVHVVLDYLVDTKEPKSVPMWSTRTEADVVRLAEDVAQIEQSIQQGIFYRQTEGWHCSGLRCGYYARCMKKRR